ncbi:MAG: cache domain-containing protein [Methanoregulaceae archaeon]|nr:cache domain-containing protein [Methanoregulaceae archaeon]
MQCRFIPIAALFVVGIFLVTAGCVRENPEDLISPILSPAGPQGSSNATMVAFVREAVAFARVNGRETALAEFSNRNGSFFRGDLYIYAYDFNGTTIAHPVNPEKIGVNRLNERDAKGNRFIRLLQEQALNGSGFARYYYLNPVHNNTVEAKLGFVMKVDDTWWLGSGIYETE